MRGVKGIHRNCKTCGAPFTVDGKTGGKLYCSDKCREIGQAKWREEHRYDKTYRYTPKKPHEITCKRCGKTFILFAARYPDLLGRGVMPLSPLYN